MTITFRPPNLIRKLTSIEEQVHHFRVQDSLILNIGSSGRRFGPHCINLDVQFKVGVDVQGDAHFLPFASSTFDVCILSAVLQYCHDPSRVACEVHRVLKPGGYAFIDAPFVQPYCPDMPDLYRFTKHGLERLWKDKFQIVTSCVSIPGSSAIAFYGQMLASYGCRPRLVRGALTLFLSILLYPLALSKTGRQHEIAGANLVVVKKIGEADLIT